MAKLTKTKTAPLSLVQKLEKVMPGAGSQIKALAEPYAQLAQRIATSLAAGKVMAEKAKSEKASTWDEFKGAIDVALVNGHNTGALASGLQIACEEAGIPAGSFRGYSSTIQNLFQDICDGNLTREQVGEMSVKDARERYQDQSKKDAKALQERLLAVYAKLDDAGKLALVEKLESAAKAASEGQNIAEALAA